MKIFPIVAGVLISVALTAGLYETAVAGSDGARPSVIASTNPEEEISGADISSPISITFTEDIDPSTLTPDTFYVYSMDNLEEFAIPGKIRYDAGSRTATFIPDGDLSYSTNYIVTIEEGVKTLSGRRLEPSYSWRFTTRNSIGGCGGS